MASGGRICLDHLGRQCRHCLGLSSHYALVQIPPYLPLTTKLKPPKGPLFDLPSTSRAESSNRKDSRRSSQRPAKAHFDRLYEESEPGVALQPLAKGKEGARTSPNIVASNEVMDKAPTKPLHSVNSTSRREDQYYPNRSTRRGSYE